MKKFLIVSALLALPSLAAAQSPTNPVALQFDHADIAITTRYEVGYFLADAVAPVQTVSVLTAAVTGTGTTNREILLSKPALGTFTAKLRAVGAAAGGGEAISPWSGPTVPFVFSPLAPTVRGLR